jgi:hypothetical protein
MQNNKFSTGGGVIHGITGDFKGKVSAWYDEAGKLEDAEQILPNYKTRPVLKNGPLWNYVAGKVRRVLLLEEAAKTIQSK